MAVTYTKTGFSKIIDKLRQTINDEFRNVYISDTFVEKAGGESWKLSLIDSSEILTHKNFEVREYSVSLRYYMEHKDSERRTEHVMNSVDRMKKHLLDNLVSSGNWDELIVDEIAYNVQDDDNEERPELSITDLSITMTSTIAYS